MIALVTNLEQPENLRPDATWIEKSIVELASQPIAAADLPILCDRIADEKTIYFLAQAYNLAKKLLDAKVKEDRNLQVSPLLAVSLVLRTKCQDHGYVLTNERFSV